MAMVKQQVLSPAKVNLMLRVLSQRPDGYHNLQTCFQILNWGDHVTFEQINRQGSKHVEVSGFKCLATTDNLIYQAAQIIKPWAQLSSDWKISVDKQIPMGAGLGGGSSNAAAVLKFLNEHWRCDLSTFDLLALAAKLGADVPVFVMGQSALATGIGEVLTPMQFNTPYILLLFPECQIKTANLFKRPDLIRNQAQLGADLLQDQSFWINDFFPIVLKKFPKISSIYKNLQAAINLKLSGTGSTLFALFNDYNSAQSAQQLADKECRTIIVEPQRKT